LSAREAALAERLGVSQPVIARLDSGSAVSMDRRTVAVPEMLACRDQIVAALGGEAEGSGGSPDAKARTLPRGMRR
jgi:hypothetical protein